MRIWHEKLIPKLCQKHLCAMWREGLGCYKLVRNNKVGKDIVRKGYQNHPATIEFEQAAMSLWERLKMVRDEMKRRGYHPKRMPTRPSTLVWWYQEKPWQTLDEQIAVLKSKKCKCNV